MGLPSRVVPGSAALRPRAARRATRPRRRTARGLAGREGTGRTAEGAASGGRGSQGDPPRSPPEAGPVPLLRSEGRLALGEGWAAGSSPLNPGRGQGSSVLKKACPYMPTQCQPQVCGSFQERKSLGQLGSTVKPHQVDLWAHTPCVTEILWTSERPGSTWRRSRPAAEIMRKECKPHCIGGDPISFRGVLRDSQEALTLTLGLEVFWA